MNLFLDTSALIKLYHNEIGTSELLNFIKMNSKELIITITDISKIEFYNSRRRCRGTPNRGHSVPLPGICTTTLL